MEGSNGAPLSEVLGAPLDGPLTVWSREVIETADGRVSEDVRGPDDPAIAARLDELTGDRFYDPTFDVSFVDFSGGDDERTWRHGSRLVVTPREDEDLGAEREVIEAWERGRRARRPPSLPSAEETLEADLVAAAGRGEEDVPILIVVAPEPVTAVPARPTSPVALSPLDTLDRRVARREAIVARGEEVVGLQAPFAEWLEEEGGTVMAQLWLRNWMYARVPLALVPRIQMRPEVRAVSYVHPQEVDGTPGHTMTVLRDKMQTQDYLDAGIDGFQASSRNDWGIWLAIVEPSETLDLSHPGLKDYDSAFDCDYSLGAHCRVKATFTCNDATVPACPGCATDCVAGLPACVEPPDPNSSDHGMAVLTVAAADFMDDQDPSLTATQRSSRSGHAQEAHILMMTHEPTCMGCVVQKVIEQGADVVSHSGGSALTCDAEHASALLVNDAFNDGVLWINSMGNQSACEAASCHARIEAAAAGSVAVGQYEAFNNEDPDTSPICHPSSKGGAAWGPIADLLAPGAAFAFMMCDGEYFTDTLGCSGTSIATPHVAGASALLMDFWIATYSDATAHQPGRMHAVLLNMGDTCGSNTDIHPDWGAGRLKMRMFNAAGVDAPWGHETASYTFSPADTSKFWPVYVDGAGNPLALPDDVDTVSASVFCYYDGFDYDALPGMNFRIYDLDAATGTYAADTDGEKAIARRAADAHRYEVRLTLSGIPAGKTVKCWMNRVWEDSDRDDADGPPADVDPYPVPGSLASTCKRSC